MALGSRRSLFRCYTNAEWKERTFWVTVNTTISVQHPSALVLSPYSLPPLLLFSFFLFLIIDSNSSDTYLFIEFTVFISRLRISYVFIHKMWLIRECLKYISIVNCSNRLREWEYLWDAALRFSNSWGSRQCWCLSTYELRVLSDRGGDRDFSLKDAWMPASAVLGSDTPPDPSKSR